MTMFAGGNIIGLMSTEPLEVRIMKLAMQMRLHAHQLRQLEGAATDACCAAAFSYAAVAYENSATLVESLLPREAEHPLRTLDARWA